MPVTDGSLKMLLSRLAWFIQRSEGATGKEGHHYFYFTAEETEESWSCSWRTATCPPLEKLVGNLWRKILLLPLQLTLSPEQWILLELNNCWVVHSQLHTKNPTVPDLIQLYSCFNLFSLHMNVGEGNWYRGVVIFMEEQESEKVHSSSVYYS